VVTRKKVDTVLESSNDGGCYRVCGFPIFFCLIKISLVHKRFTRMSLVYPSSPVIFTDISDLNFDS